MANGVDTPIFGFWPISDISRKGEWNGAEKRMQGEKKGEMNYGKWKKEGKKEKRS